MFSLTREDDRKTGERHHGHCLPSPWFGLSLAGFYLESNMDWEATIYARRLVGENEPYFATSYPVKADLARPCCLPRHVQRRTPPARRHCVTSPESAGPPRATSFLTLSVRFFTLILEYARINSSNLGQQHGCGSDYGSSDEPYARSGDKASNSRPCTIRRPGRASFVAQ
jgi:hypothetical protein